VESKALAGSVIRSDSPTTARRCYSCQGGESLVTMLQGKSSGWLATAVLFLAVAMLLVPATEAFAYKETSGTPPPSPLGHGRTTAGAIECMSCHGYSEPAGNCRQCHAKTLNGGDTTAFGKGPHAGYTTGAIRCAICHSTHAAPADNAMLLPRATVTATCEMCHDGTGGRGVYGAIYAQTGAVPGQQHRVDQTNLVPGGDASTGATTTASFSGLGSTLGCSDCHSPHGANTVSAFPGERRRVPYSTPGKEAWQQTVSNRLLLTRPGNATKPVDVYGSDWCIACHQGRMAGATGDVKNHPGDSGGPFTYANVAKLSSDASTSVTVMGPLGGDNRGYLMPSRSTSPTRTPLQVGHAPICQQCHEDSRFVGTMAGDEASASPLLAVLDGATTDGSANPRFQNFPHETQNVHLLVETGDSLCLNCHKP